MIEKRGKKKKKRKGIIHQKDEQKSND